MAEEDAVNRGRIAWALVPNFCLFAVMILRRSEQKRYPAARNSCRSFSLLLRRVNLLNMLTPWHVRENRELRAFKRSASYDSWPPQSIKNKTNNSNFSGIFLLRLLLLFRTFGVILGSTTHWFRDPYLWANFLLSALGSWATEAMVAAVNCFLYRKQNQTVTLWGTYKRLRNYPLQHSGWPSIDTIDQSIARLV